MLQQPVRHGAWSQIRAGKNDQVPPTIKTIQHELLFLFGIAKSMKTDWDALVDVDSCQSRSQLDRADAGNDLYLKPLESTQQPFQAGRQARLSNARNSQHSVILLCVANGSTSGADVVVHILKVDFLAVQAIFHRLQIQVPAQNNLRFLNCAPCRRGDQLRRAGANANQEGFPPIGHQATLRAASSE